MSNQRKGPETGRPGDREGARASDRKSNEKDTTRSRDGREEGFNYNPSGHFDPREPRSSRGRAKKLAEAWSFQSIGDDSAWEEYFEEAKGEVNWDDYVKWLKRKGWEYIEPYRYENPNDDLLYEVWRFEYAKLRSKKLFVPRHKENGKWVRGMPPVRVPYNLLQLLKRPDENITLVEGEKGVNAVKKEILATCIHGQQWTSEAVAFLTDRTVNVAMDNDASGRKNIETALEMLSQVDARVRVIELPGLRPGKGLDDWLKDHSVEEYRELVAKTPIEGRISTAPHPFPAEETIERYEWLLGRHLLRGEVSATVGTGGTGKSTLAITEALSMASGKQLLHDFVPKHPLRMILVNLEDRRSTMDKRVAAAMRHHGLTPADIGDRLIILAKGEIKIQIAKQLRSGEVERNEEEIKKLTALMLERQADVLSVDSFIRTHAVLENDNKAMEAAIECFEEIAIASNCAVHLWHHTRKMNGDQTTVESARGAQAFIDTCRSVRVLEKMTKTERNNIISILPDMKETGYYVKEFNGKRNFSEPAEEANWFELANIKLHNWRSDFEDDGDYIGVASKWYYPKIELPKIDDIAINQILKAIRAGGPWRASAASKKEPWIGVPIAEVLELNLAIKQAKDFVAKVIVDLLGKRRLKRVTRPDTHREPKEYIEAAAVPEPGTAGNDGENS
jgi:hypothetical protein